MKQPPTVFVVDDRPNVTDALKTVLKSHAYPCECVSSADQFIADLDPNQVGCVLIDPLMNANGHAVLKWLHTSGSLLSIVLLSGLIDSVDHLRQTQTPRIAEKPYEVSALLTMVADGLAGSLSRQAVRDRSRLKG